jgi:hypothetical protein
MAENYDKKKVPEFFEKNVPWFDDENPEELSPFLESIECRMELAETADDEKNGFVTRYPIPHVVWQWKKFESYGKTYLEFKKEILENYPSAVDSDRGSRKKLRKAMKAFEDGEIGQLG